MSHIISVKDMCLWYGDHKALNNVNIEISEKSITAFIGPSGCGKSTFLKTLNRMNDLIPGVKITGDICYNGTDIFAKEVDEEQMVISLLNFEFSYFSNIHTLSGILGKDLADSAQINKRAAFIADMIIGYLTKR